MTQEFTPQPPATPEPAPHYKESSHALLLAPEIAREYSEGSPQEQPVDAATVETPAGDSSLGSEGQPQSSEVANTADPIDVLSVPHTDEASELAAKKEELQTRLAAEEAKRLGVVDAIEGKTERVEQIKAAQAAEGSVPAAEIQPEGAPSAEPVSGGSVEGGGWSLGGSEHATPVASTLDDATVSGLEALKNDLESAAQSSGETPPEAANTGRDISTETQDTAGAGDKPPAKPSQAELATIWRKNFEDKHGQLNEANARLAAAEAENEALKASLEAAQQENRELKERISQLEDRLTAIEAKINGADDANHPGNIPENTDEAPEAPTVELSDEEKKNKEAQRVADATKLALEKILGWNVASGLLGSEVGKAMVAGYLATPEGRQRIEEALKGTEYEGVLDSSAPSPQEPNAGGSNQSPDNTTGVKIYDGVDGTARLPWAPGVTGPREPEIAPEQDTPDESGNSGPGRFRQMWNRLRVGYINGTYRYVTGENINPEEQGDERPNRLTKRIIGAVAVAGSAIGLYYLASRGWVNGSGSGQGFSLGSGSHMDTYNFGQGNGNVKTILPDHLKLITKNDIAEIVNTKTGASILKGSDLPRGMFSPDDSLSTEATKILIRMGYQVRTVPTEIFNANGAANHNISVVS